MLNHDCRENHRSLAATGLAFAHSSSFAIKSMGNIEPDEESDAKRAQAMRSVDIALVVALCAYITTLFLTVLDATIGIKRFIQNLYTGKVMLYICRYIAYIVPIGHGNESAKHSETRSNNRSSS